MIFVQNETTPCELHIRTTLKSVSKDSTALLISTTKPFNSSETTKDSKTKLNGADTLIQLSQDCISIHSLDFTIKPCKDIILDLPNYSVNLADLLSLNEKQRIKLELTGLYNINGKTEHIRSVLVIETIYHNTATMIQLNLYHFSLMEPRRQFHIEKVYDNTN